MLLAIDTATQSLSLALHDGQQVIAERTWTTAGRHTVELTPAIQNMLAQAHITVSSLAGIAVSQGPGSFNGLRVGFSAAKGLALAQNIPVITVPTLDILAAGQPSSHEQLIAVAQAGRGRICAASYRWQKSAWIGQNDVAIVGWQGLVEQVSEATVISGEIDAGGYAVVARSVAAGKPIRLADPAYRLRRAGFLAELAWKRLHAGEAGDASSAVPLYLHQPGVAHP